MKRWLNRILWPAHRVELCARPWCLRVATWDHLCRKHDLEEFDHG